MPERDLRILGGTRVIFERGGEGGELSGERKGVSGGGDADAGVGGQIGLQLVPQGGGSEGAAWAEFGGDNRIGLEARIDGEKVPEAIQEQAGADEKDGGEGGFDKDERGTGGGNARETMGLPGGEKAEEETAAEGDESGEGEDTEVDDGFGETGCIGGEDEFEEMELLEGEEDARGTRGEGEGDGLRNHLAEQTGGGGAKRDTEGEFAFAGGGLAEQEVGDIDDGDEENEGDDAQEEVAA